MSTEQHGASTPAPRSYFAAAPDFPDGDDSPRAFLERCISAIDAEETLIGAFVETDFEKARTDADASAARWSSGRQLSPIDGMPVGIKDIMETADMATAQGSPLFEGWKGGRDCAAVAALREAGAVILGKTVTTEFASTHARGTRNPWDPDRTPGGSSSGSAAAVAAGMAPAALGSQVIGSTIRPASYCGVFGYKPSIGGINRGGSFDGFSQSCTGVIAASLDEVWTVAREISARAGGDPGHVGIVGPTLLPASARPASVAFLRTAGWDKATADAKVAFREARDRVEAAGIRTVDMTTAPSVALVEEAIGDAFSLSMRINAWEGRWPLNTYKRDMDPAGLSDSAHERLDQAEAMTQEEYGELLDERNRVRRVYDGLLDEVEACITLSAPAAAPLGLNWTGDPSFTVHTSLIGMPSVTLPVLRDDGLPLGLQIIGFTGRDAALMAVAGAVMALF